MRIGAVQRRHDLVVVGAGLGRIGPSRSVVTTGRAARWWRTTAAPPTEAFEKPRLLGVLGHEQLDDAR
jgi:hypothetical protein